MKKSIIALSLLLSTVATAATLHAPDQMFIDNASKVGITQKNWDDGKSAKLTMQNAYKFTHSVEMKNGKYVHDLGKPKGFNLNLIAASDIDGKYPMEVIIRDRLNTAALVILKNGKLVDEYYWNGMNKDKTHLQMSITKSFTSLTLQTLVAEGKVNMDAPITDYLPELKNSKGFSKATLQEVADMRSAIKITFTKGKLWDDRMTNVQQWNGTNNYPELNSILDFAELVDVRADVKAGETFDYQCINTEMLGMVVQRVTGNTLASEMENRLWKKVGFGNDAVIQSNSQGEAVASGGLNATPRDVALMMDVLVNNGKNRNGEQIISKTFIDKLLSGNDKVRSAWANGSESKLAANAWYKDQIRVFEIEGHKFLAFVGINGQVTIGEPLTGIVLQFNSAQDEMQAKRTVSMTFLDVVPTLLDSVQQQETSKSIGAYFNKKTGKVITLGES